MAMKNLLVVEDDAASNMLLTAILQESGLARQYGFYVISAWDGMEAADIVRCDADGEIKAAFVDIILPGMNGLEFMRRVRRREAAKGVAAINRMYIATLTACAFKSDMDAAFDAGADYFMKKPFKMEEMNMVLGRMSDHIGAALKEIMITG